MTMNGDYSVNIGPVTLNGGDLSSDGFSTVTWGSYTLQGDVTAGAGISTISAVNVNGSGARTFTVASGGNLNVTGTFSYMTMIKAGAGTMQLSGANTFTGNILVNTGTLTGNFATSANPTTSAFGNATVGGRTITVAPGATLSLTANDSFGSQAAVAANLPSLLVSSTMSTTRYNQIGAITLDGATLTSSNISDSNN